MDTAPHGGLSQQLTVLQAANTDGALRSSSPDGAGVPTV